jgi:hypothetical protein
MILAMQQSNGLAARQSKWWMDEDGATKLPKDDDICHFCGYLSAAKITKELIRYILSG